MGKRSVTFRRRDVLRSGAIAGLSIFGATDIVIASESKNENIQQTQSPFLELSLRFPGINDGLEMAGRRQYPSFIDGSKGVYITDYLNESISIEGKSSLVATHMGLKQLDSPARVASKHIPTMADSKGHNIILSGGDMDAEIVLESAGHEAVVVFDGKRFSLRPQETQEIHRSLSIHYQTHDGVKKMKKADASLSVSNHGKTNIISHENKILIPKDSPGGNHIKNHLSKSGNKSSTLGRDSKNSSIEVTDIKSVEAFGIRVRGQRGES